jgi:alkylated DNA nucleotide flippase Atl1
LARHGKGTKSTYSNGSEEIMAYSENKLYTTLTKRLVEAFGESPKGTLIGYDDITKEIGFDRNTKEGAAVLEKFKRALRKRVAIRCVDNVGISILQDEEAASRVPVERAMRARRQANRGIQELSTVNEGRLSDHLRRVRFQSMEKLRFIRLMAGRAKREHEKETRVSETTPRRPRPATAK